MRVSPVGSERSRRSWRAPCVCWREPAPRGSDLGDAEASEIVRKHRPCTFIRSSKEPVQWLASTNTKHRRRKRRGNPLGFLMGDEMSLYLWSVTCENTQSSLTSAFGVFFYIYIHTRFRLSAVPRRGDVPPAPSAPRAASEEPFPPRRALDQAAAALDGLPPAAAAQRLHAGLGDHHLRAGEADS